MLRIKKKNENNYEWSDVHKNKMEIKSCKK